MITIKEAILVEGRYDVNTVRQIVDTVVLEAGGFRIFHDAERISMIRRIAATRGLLILTDSDGAGLVIRNFLKCALPKKQIKQAYVPEIFGRETRKRQASKEGKLGVEGMRPAVILEALRRAGATILGEQQMRDAVRPITKADFYELGLTGTPNSAARRQFLLKALHLPTHLSSNALLEFINAVSTREEVLQVLSSLPSK